MLLTQVNTVYVPSKKRSGTNTIDYREDGMVWVDPWSVIFMKPVLNEYKKPVGTHVHLSDGFGHVTVSEQMIDIIGKIKAEKEEGE